MRITSVLVTDQGGSSCPQGDICHPLKSPALVSSLHLMPSTSFLRCFPASVLMFHFLLAARKLSVCPLIST